LLLMVGCVVLASGDELPPGVVNTQNPSDVPLSPQESLKRITVPEGFHVTLFAGEPDLRRPIAFDFDDRGRMWVIENYSHPEWRKDRATDRILIFEDSDHDGRFDSRKVFWDKGRYLTGLAVGHGGVWIANTPELSFIPDRDRDDLPDSDPVVMLDGFQQSSNNVLNNFHWGPDGWLYGAIGLSTPSLVGKPGAPEEQRTPITRGIWRFHPVRYDFEVVAEGMVNPWGADFNEYGDLFTSNTVIAHLWHIVPGMYCERRDAESDNPYAYRRIQSITNHLHWGGGQWQSSRNADDRHSVAGGGHAHCGGMVYLGDNFPKKYRGTFFTANLHGNRVNNDQLVPNKSTYVGVHADDFLFGNDPWFRGLSVKYGPDGGVYISDWHDLGECHDTDGSHRSSGRIFKVVYGRPKKHSIELQRSTDLQLAELHLHPNEWFVRHARRILHERAAAGRDVDAAKQRLAEIFRNDDDEVKRLRAFFTLFLVKQFDEAALIDLLQHDDQHVRRWAVPFLIDDGSLSSDAVDALAKLARSETSPKVRLALASSLQKLERKHRWSIAEALMSYAEDAQDAYLPLIIWYGVEPLVATDTARALKLASGAKIPMIRRFIARRALDVDKPPVDQVLQVALDNDSEDVRFDVLRGALDALEGQGNQTPPRCWPELYAQMSGNSDASSRSIAVRLATIFGDEQAIGKLRQTALNSNEPESERRDALRALLNLEDGVPVSMLHKVVRRSSTLRRDAIQALVLRNDPSTANVLLDVYSRLEPVERQDAISVLCTRRNFASLLLTAIEKEVVSRDEVSAFALQQLRAFSDSGLKKRVAALWADDAQRLQKSDEIARLKQRMTPEYLQKGDVHGGRRIFERTCSKCHSLFGEGGSLAPELTGSGRKNLDYLLSNLFDPSAVIDPAFRLTMIQTSDGRVLSGFIVRQTDKFLILRTQEAQIRLAMNEIDELQASTKSMMPEGMLRGYSDEQVRDLLLYLASPRQVTLPQSINEE
jgi:putative membrane-bound dehydrogenase-like protein